MINAILLILEFKKKKKTQKNHNKEANYLPITICCVKNFTLISFHFTLVSLSFIFISFDFIFAFF